MSTNPYISYYTNQAGSGITGFDGIRFQRGNGFFRNLFKNAIFPVLKYLGKKVAATGVQVASDALDGENVLSSIKARGKRAAQDIAGDVGDRAVRFAQTGEGKRRRRTQRKGKKNQTRKKKSKGKRFTKNIFG